MPSKLVGIVCLLFLSSAALRAQSAADNLVVTASEALQSGNTKKAIGLYEEIIAKYPTFLGIWATKYNLGFAHYLNGKFDKALPLFKEIAGPKTPDPDLREQSMLLLGNVQSAMAGTLTGTDQTRQFDAGISAFNDYLKAYPQGKLRGDALYSKGATQLQADKVDDAEKTMNEFFRDFSKSSLKNEASYLLGRIYATQAKVLREQKKETDAARRTQDARKIFDQLSAQDGDLLLANDARYSAGEILASAGAYTEAITFLRRVRPQAVLEEQQTQVLNRLRAARAQAVKEGNKPLQDDLSRQIDRGTQRLALIGEKGILYLSAQQLIAKSLYEQKKYDEMLVLNRHYLPHFTPDQQKRARYLTIKAFLEKKDIDKAILAYNEFKSLYPKDKIGEEIPITIGDFFLRAGKYDESTKWCDEYEANFPTGAFLEQAYFLASTSASQSGNTAEAERRNQKFREKFPKSSLAGQALFNKAYTSYQKKDYAGAIPDFREFIKKFSDSEAAENSAFFIAVSLCELKKWDDAIKELQAYEKSYPKSKSLPNVLYQLGKAYEEKKDIANANQIHARVVKEFPGESVAPYSQIAIALNLLGQGSKSYPQALVAFDQFIHSFPTHALTPSAYLYKAEILRNQSKIEEAAVVYRELVAKFPESDAAADSMVTLGEMFFQKAGKMAAKPEKLPADKQVEYKELLQKAQAAYEEVLHKYPANPAVDKALSQLSLLWQTRISAGFGKKEEAREFFTKLASDSDAAQQVKIAFTLGGLLNLLQDKAASIQVLSEAFQKAGNISLPNEGYLQYRNALIEGGKFDEAIAVSERQLAEKEQANDERGIAEALLGLGRAYFEKGDLAKSSENLSAVITRYPWHETAAPEAEFYKIWIEEKKKNYDEAINLYTALQPRVRDPELRVRIFMRLGYAWLAKSEVASGPLKLEAVNQSLGFFLKIGLTFTAYPQYAAEGLFRAASLLEIKTGLVTDARTKTESSQNAAKFFKRCADEYASTEWGIKAKEHLKSAPPAK